MVTNYIEKQAERNRKLTSVADASRHFFNSNDTALPLLEVVAQWMHDTGKIEDSQKLLVCIGAMEQQKCVS